MTATCAFGREPTSLVGARTCSIGFRHNFLFARTMNSLIFDPHLTILANGGFEIFFFRPAGCNLQFAPPTCRSHLWQQINKPEPKEGTRIKGNEGQGTWQKAAMWKNRWISIRTCFGGFMSGKLGMGGWLVAVRQATMPNCSLLMSMWSPLGTHFGCHYQLLVRLDRPVCLFFCPSRLSNANFVSLSIWCGVCLHLVAHLVARTGAYRVPRKEMEFGNSFASFRMQVLNFNWVLHVLKNE